MPDHQHKTVLIIGGGTAGTTTAAHLVRAGAKNVAIIEPSATHYYQPLWTLVGGGVFAKEVSTRPQTGLIPPGVEWLRTSAAEIDPVSNTVVTARGTRISYDFLVVATGIEFNPSAIPGLCAALQTPSVTTNYNFDMAPKTWRLLQEFRGGVALFHMPSTPIKCPGAPQKIMYLAADYFRKHKVSADVVYGSALGGIYGIKEYVAVLSGVVERYGIDARYNHQLVSIEPSKREGVFEDTASPEKTRTTIQYDFFHVVPPQRAPVFLRQSPLVDAQGWVKVDKNTMRNPDFPNVFALGDVGNSPNAKTGASACKQAPVVAANLLSVMQGREPAAEYDGYVACPIVTSYNKMLLCEFDYSKKPKPTLPVINTCKERYDMWLLKKYGLPWVYWNVALRGKTVPFLGAITPEALRAGVAAAEP